MSRGWGWGYLRGRMYVIGMGYCKREILQISDLTSRGIIVISVSFFTVLNNHELICKVIFANEATTCILHSPLSLNEYLYKTDTYVIWTPRVGLYLYLLPLFDSLEDRHLPKTDT